MTPRSPTISNFCYYLPLYEAYFGTDVPDLRLALYRITDNLRRTVEALL